MTDIYKLVIERERDPLFFSKSIRLAATCISLYCFSIGSGSVKACEPDLVGWESFAVYSFEELV